MKVRFMWDWVLDWVVLMIVVFAKLMSKQPFLSHFFMGVVASYAVGSGSLAYNEGRYQNAYDVLKPAADYEIDDPYVGTAQFYMALLFFNGYGVKQDKDLAEEYLKKAAERDNEDAIKYLEQHK